MAKTKQQQTDIKIYNNMQIIYTFNIYFIVQVLYRTEPNRTDPNRTEPNRTEQNRTEQNKTEQNRTEQNRIFILFKHIQLITITKLQNAWIIKYTYTV